MPDKINSTQDGKKVTAEKGKRIWEAANWEGIGILQLCHQDEPGYMLDSNCRACMVEI